MVLTPLCEYKLHGSEVAAGTRTIESLYIKDELKTPQV